MSIAIHRLMISLLFSTFTIIANSQGMEDAKWWMGVKAGANFTRVNVDEKFSIFEYYSTPAHDNSKQYKSLFRNTGPSIGLTLSYAATANITISIQPSYISYHLGYTTQYVWKDTLKNEYSITNTLKTKLHYLELPILFRYEYTFGKVQPYLQIGAYYSYLLNGKNIAVSEEKRKDTGGEVSLDKRVEDYNVNQQYLHSLYGLMGGAGVSVDVNYFRIALECNYRYGLNNITNRKNRLEQQRMINGTYEVPDDIKLQNLEFTLHCSTPLDYLIHTPGMSGKAGKVRRR